MINLPEASKYPEAYKSIVNALRSAGLHELGTRTPRKDKDGEERAASLDLGVIERIGRTSTVINLTDIQLSEWHRVELEIGGFFFGYDWMKRKFHWIFEPVVLSDARMEAIKNFQSQNRPPLPKFRDVSIPPYFPLDNTFDGLEFHHRLDRAFWTNRDRLSLPAVSSGRVSGRKLLAETA